MSVLSGYIQVVKPLGLNKQRTSIFVH